MTITEYCKCLESSDFSTQQIIYFLEDGNSLNKLSYVTEDKNEIENLHSYYTNKLDN